MEAPGSHGNIPPGWAAWFERALAALLIALLVGILLDAFVPRDALRAQEQDDRKTTPFSTDPFDPFPLPPEMKDVQLLQQTDAEKAAKSQGCIVCHKDAVDPHFKATLRLGCTDCHGGDASASDKRLAHVSPRFPECWPTSANPVRSYTLLNHESPDFIRFVNPGDFRIAHISCGTSGCHPKEVQTNRKQIMSTGCMLWGAALYNNGTIPNKRARYGEAYSMAGAPLRLLTNPPPTEKDIKHGVVPFLDPLPRFEVGQPGNILRIFEIGGRFRPEIGIPERLDDPGRSKVKLSDRGLGTENRTDPGLVSLNKTRLFDPTLNFMGTNDHPGDYRSSGCTACHVVYANDRSPIHSGPYAAFGNKGTTSSSDPTIPKDEPGHPIEHRFTNAIPTSQCIVCHIHPGTNVMNSYLGYMWWDEETHGRQMYPQKEKHPTPEEAVRYHMSNPDAASQKGNWSNPEFLNDLVNLNPQLDKTQFADFHGHGWVFRAVYKKDIKGNLLDHQGIQVQNVIPAKLASAVNFPLKAKAFHKDNRFPDAKGAVAAEQDLDRKRGGDPVHLMDIHLEKGMHCIDCHFSQDMHGNGKLHMEVRAATEIQCIDCHGTSSEFATLKTSGPASYTSAPDELGRNLASLRTPFGLPRFEIEYLSDEKEKGPKRIYQNSCVEKGLRWEVVQTKDTITEGHARYNAKSAIAKTVRFEGDDMVYGAMAKDGKCAHENKNMSCIACHSAWNPSCFGCHLPQKANIKMPQLHALGELSRNYTEYNFQTLREDAYMLARDGDTTGNRIGPARSSCAIHVGSTNGNRESIYVQQQTISTEGFGGTAFSTNVPHTVRGKGFQETKTCTDCHLAKDGANNAWMAQLLMHGTNTMNFIGKFAWVAAGEEGLAGVVVTETAEPQAVVGSTLHEVAFPEEFAKHAKRNRQLEKAYEHPGKDISQEIAKPWKKPEILQVQARGEFLYAACGSAGVRIFDIANIDNKGFSERIVSAPVSPTGQKFYVKTPYATAVAAPTTVAVDPTRTHLPENKEGPIHPYFGYLYVTDLEQGLILVGAATTIDGNPVNNFLKPELVFNPDGLLKGAVNVTLAGIYAYVCCDAGVVVVSLDNPKEPKVTAILDKQLVCKPKAVQVQFRYAYVCDEEGVKVFDVTDMGRPVPKSMIRMNDVHNIYLARQYAYVSAGSRGLVILDISKAEEPKIDQVFTAEGAINDLHDLKIGITYNSIFAYLADGRNGMRVVQLTSPETPGYDGFGAKPYPKLVATYKIPHGGHALSISKGLDRDRAVDEQGNQIGVFGRVGARPLNGDEQRRFYLHNGSPWFVSDDANDPIYRRKP